MEIMLWNNIAMSTNSKFQILEYNSNCKFHIYVKFLHSYLYKCNLIYKFPGKF